MPKVKYLMKRDHLKKDIQKLNSLLVIGFGFILPMWVAPTNILAGIIFLLWAIYGDHKKNLTMLRHNKFIWAILFFVLLHFIGFLWTSDTESGLEIAGKELLLLLIPVFMMVLRKEHIHYAILSFMLSMIFSAIWSILICSNIAPKLFVPDNSGDPILFMGRISYSPFLTIAIYLSLYHLLFASNRDKYHKIISAFVAVAMTFVLFSSNGRAGQVMFIFMLFIIILQWQNQSLIKAVVFFFISIFILISVAYNCSDGFRARVNQAVLEARECNTSTPTSVGLRINFVRNSFAIFQQHPLFGVGTGDFKDEYQKINRLKSPGLPATVQPHNMYVLEMVQFGVIGLISLLWILYAQINIAIHSTDLMQSRFGLALPILFAVIMFSDSYLLGHFTTMLFIYFSSILYRLRA